MDENKQSVTNITNLDKKKETEIFNFFSELSKLCIAADISHKQLYLSIGSIILDELKNSPYKEIKGCVNDLYKFLLHNVDALTVKDWERASMEADKIITAAGSRHKEFVQKCCGTFFDEMHKEYKENQENKEEGTLYA